MSPVGINTRLHAPIPSWESENEELKAQRNDLQTRLNAALKNVEANNLLRSATRERANALIAASRTAADWLSRSTRPDDREQGQDLHSAIAAAESAELFLPCT
jgi:cell division septum initiation protein DivIVA